MKRSKRTKYSELEKSRLRLERKQKLQNRTTFLKKESLKIQKCNLRVQILIVIALLLAFSATIYSVYQQREFNRNVLRPWIACEVDVEKPITIDRDGAVRILYILKNYGPTPACYVKSYSNLTFSEFFDGDFFKQKIATDTSATSFFIYPNQI